MENLITVVSLQGQAWAVAQDGSRRELKVGDTIAADEMVITADGAQIDLQFANNNQVLTLIGEQETEMLTHARPEPSLSQPLTPISDNEAPPKSTPSRRSVDIEEGHGFVQLVRIAEIIEADGFTPLTVARIQEIIKPLGMILPERDFEQDRWKEHESRSERGETAFNSIPINLPPMPVGSLSPQNNLDAEENIELELDLDKLFNDPEGEPLTYTVNNLPPGLSFDPNTGKITGTIDRSASQGGNTGTKGEYKVIITAKDPSGNTGEQSFIWKVTNPAPEAEPDAGETLKSARLTKDAANGVLKNDSDPDGDPLFVQDVTHDGKTVSKDANGELVIKGKFGTLVLKPDGSYVYTPDLSDNTGPVWTLEENKTLEDTFTYTVSDGEGGTAEAELVITIHGHSNKPPFLIPEDHNDVGNSTVAGHVTVHEKGLGQGTDPGQGHRAEGVINVHAMDGLKEITITDKDGTLRTFDLDDLKGLPATPSATIEVEGGTLTLTGFEPIVAVYPGGSHVVGGEIKYTYELTADQEHPAGDGNNSRTLDIQLEVKDDQGAYSTSDLIVNVIDDVPTAIDDENEVTEGEGVDDVSSIATGNVIGKGGTIEPSGGDKADSTGAGGATVTQIKFGTESQNVPVGGDVTIDGEYGTLTIQPDGSYTYVLDNSNLKVQGLHPDDPSLTDAFEYTITDADGDPATATLTIIVKGTNDGVTVDIPTVHDVPVNDKGVPNEPDKYTKTGDHVVFESGLDGGSSPNDDAIKVVSSFTIEALDGLDPDAAVSITYKDENGDEKTLEITKDDLEGLTPGTSQTITTQYGKLVLNGYNQATDGKITIDYEYTLINAPEVPGVSTNDDFTIKASDRDTDEDTKTLSIKIIDDAPTAENDANEVTAADGDDVTASTATGNVIGTGGATEPSVGNDVADTTGADGATVSAITSTNTPANDAIPSTDTSHPEGTLVIEGQYGTLTIHPDGSYSYELDNNNLDVQKLHPDDADLEEAFNYTITDGDGDEASADLIITINGANDGVTVKVPNLTDPNDPSKPGEDYPVEDPNDPNKPTWGGINDHVVFESGLVGGSQNSSDTEVVGELVKVKSSFTLSALDGLNNDTAITFAVTGKTDVTLTKTDVGALSTTSKTIDTEHGELVLNGYTLNDNGTITIDYEYTLTSAPENTAAGDGTDAGKFTDDTIKITVNDRDSTPDTATEDLVIRIMDDVPTVSATGTHPANLVVDESTMGTSAEGSFASAFKHHFGADGAATANSFVYSLAIDNTAEGLADLKDTLTGASIKLELEDDGTVKGVVDGGSADGETIFTVTVDNDGKVILKQERAMHHDEPDKVGAADVLRLPTDSIKLTATVTDKDGDTDTASVDIGDKLTFQDDGPSLDDTKIDGGFVSDNAIVDEKYLPSGSEYTDGTQLVVSKDLPIDFGADGAVNAAGDTGLVFTNTDALTALNLKSGTTDLTYALSGDGHTITATAGASDIFTIELKVATDGTPSYEFTLQGPLDHTLDAGGTTAENIVLPFDITATDGDGDSVDLKFKVEVADDTPEADRKLEVDEDDSVSFSNADINTQTVTVDDATKSVEPGNAVWTLTNGHGKVLVDDNGKITYVPDEDYRGEDSYTYTVTTANGSYERKVNITVKPVADKPLFANKDGDYPEDITGVEIGKDGSVLQGTYDYSVQTNEDVSVGLGLHVPKVKDGGSAATSDPSELLGAITLTPTGAGYVDDAKLQTGATELKPAADGKITIVITDKLGFHVTDIQAQYPESVEGTYYLTEAQYEAITAHPAEDRHENFEVAVSVKSYEVNDSGVALPDADVGGTNGAESTQTITVDVHAVTDAPELTLEESDLATTGALSLTVEPAVPADPDDENTKAKNAKITAAINEDTTLDLQSVLVEKLKDSDGSEKHWYEITGLPEGTKVTIGSKTYTAGSDGKVTMPEEDYFSSNTEKPYPVFTLTPPVHYSNPNGDPIKAVITLNSKDYDADSTVSTTTESVSVDLELQIYAVPDNVRLANPDAVEEDSTVAFLGELGLIDPDGSESITQVRITGLPTEGGDWVLYNHDGNEVAIPTGGNADTGGLVLVVGTGTGAGEYTLDQIKQFTVKPPAHSSLDGTMKVYVTTEEAASNTQSGNAESAEWAHELEIKVTPVAEKIGGKYDVDGKWVSGVNSDTDGNTQPDLTMGDSHVYQTTGEEDEWFVLGNETSASFKLSTGWSNEDGKWVADGSGNWLEVASGGRSEDTFALLTPFKTVGNSAVAGAATDGMLEGSVFTYFDGTTTHTLPFAGEPVKIPMQYLDSVRFKGPEDWSGVVKIKVQAHTIDYGEDPTDTPATATSGESWLTNLVIEPKADQVTLKVDAITKTYEDTPVELSILPTSSDKDETFNVTIEGIPKGAKITYDGVVYDTLADTLPSGLTEVGGSYRLEIEGFDKAKQPELTPPKDSNATINLKITAQSVDTLTYIDSSGVEKTITDTDPSKSQTLFTEVQVQGVPDEPRLTMVEGKVYTEDAGDQESGQLKVDLQDLITSFKSGETGGPSGGPDGSETVTLRLSDLPEGFTLKGAGPALGGSGPTRVWVISENDLENVKIIVPKHYSGTVDFTAQPVVTENDNPSKVFFDKENIEFTITPVPEATLSISSNLIEDTIGELQLAPVSSDPDEYISAVRIAVEDVEAAGITLYDANDVALTASGVFYTITNTGTTGAPSVFVKGPANFSGSKNLNIEYQVTDPATSGVGSSETSGWKTEEHTLNFGAVTDEIELTLDAVSGGTTDTDNWVTTLDTGGTVKVSLKITQKDDPNAGDTPAPDADGSEKFIHVVVSGVPEGVSVKNAVETSSGKWLLTVGGTDGIAFDDATLTQDLEFVVSGYAGTFEQEITITTYTQDTNAASIEEDSVKWTLKYENNDPDEADLPELSLEANNVPQTEDTKFALGDVVTGTITNEATTTDEPYQITVTVRTTPEDETKFEGMTRTVVTEDEEQVVLWTATADVPNTAAGQDALDTLLGSINVVTPKDANSNNLATTDNPDGKFNLDVNVAVHADGISRDAQATPELEIKPVTDELIITVSNTVVDEGESITLDIGLNSKDEADGELGDSGAGWTVVGDKVFIHIANDDELVGELYVDGTVNEGFTTAPTGAPSGLTGGKYYEVAVADLDKLEFRPDAVGAPFQTGKLGVTVWAEHTENDSDDSKVSTGTGSVEIQQSNSGYKADISATGTEADVSGDKSKAIKLDFGADAGLIDSNEEVSSAYISGLPSGFTVYMGDDADSATMANNAGDNTWAIPVTGGVLPAYIAILPPANWSGSLTGVNLTVLSGHAGLTPTPTELPIAFEVTPVASGITLNPTLSFGDAGKLVALNLNASMKDPVAATGADGDAHTERTELTLTGFPGGDKVQFFLGTEVGDGTLDGRVTHNGGGNYTIRDLTQAELDSLKFVHGTTSGPEPIVITAKTYEVDDSGNRVGDFSAEATSTMNINVSPVVATSGADKFLWDGNAINGFGGEDTVQLRFGDDLGSGDFVKLENIEVIDMRGEASGANSITGLTVEDVFNMTDDGNILKILGDAGDSVGLIGDWGAGTVVGDNTVYTANNNGQEVKLEVNTIIID